MRRRLARTPSCASSIPASFSLSEDQASLP
jgi:hypothetical protein